MTTTQESTAAPRETDGVRPPWVTEAHLQEWRGWVSRAASAGGEAAGETASLAPYDLSPIPAVPTSTPADVAAAVELGRAAQRDWATTRSRGAPRSCCASTTCSWSTRTRWST